MTRQLAPCGTQAAYTRHLRHGEQACAACRKACRDRARLQRAAMAEPCQKVAVVSGNLYPCRSHAGGVHHFAVYWPACPAGFCKLPPGHRGLHDIPSGSAVVYEAAS
jgi:hypothetical protein